MVGKSDWRWSDCAGKEWYWHSSRESPCHTSAGEGARLVNEVFLGCVGMAEHLPLFRRAFPYIYIERESMYQPVYVDDMNFPCLHPVLITGIEEVDKT